MILSLFSVNFITHKRISFFFLLLGLCIILCACNETNVEKIAISEFENVYLNHIDTAFYVGSSECKVCHAEIFDSYSKTEMGKSLKPALTSNSSAFFNHSALIYDSVKQLFYKPFLKNDSIYVHEFRVKENDTVFSRKEKINFIVGSGQHTNSHFVQRNGYVFQAPITFYTQKQEWHLPPGFERGNNSRFSRIIGTECITCHNGFSDHVKGSKNKYTNIPHGIDCERCHGPGSEHVRLKKKGVIVQTNTEIDYSIVNPAKLSADLQMDVCERCHLQGISVWKENKSHFDFKPGMALNEFVEVYQPRFTDSSETFIMASHSDRLQMSNCFQKSRLNKNMKPVTCITCHNPHESVTKVNVSKFNAVCLNCHNDKMCSESIQERNSNENNCVKCHMKTSSSYDIPHVNITDHFIVKKPISRDVDLSVLALSEFERTDKFVRLKCRTSINPDVKTTIKAYLNYFEKYAPDPKHLETVEMLINRLKDKNEVVNEEVRTEFLKSNYNKVAQLANKNFILNKLNDEWTAYRIGQSFMHLKKYEKAIDFLSRACFLAPYDFDFLNKLALCYLESGNFTKAVELYQKSYNLYPQNEETCNELGYALVLKYFNQGQGELIDAEKYFSKALKLNPDYIKAKENLCSLYLNLGNKEKARLILNDLIKQNPNNIEYLKMKSVL